jgi:antitoxin (DNA-binding transcriptional repressor) of toxin-antitoxin stability system
METEKVGMREFREQLGTYLESDRPVAITKHGRTVGFYIPARRQVELEDREALREAGRRLDAWMVEHKVDAEELTADFDRARKTGRKRDR